MNVAIVTGVSKGLGFEIAKYLLELDIEVMGLSRSTNEMVQGLLTKGKYTHIPIDLSKVEEIEPQLKKLCQKIVNSKAQRVYVINNASIVEPIERLGYLENHLIHTAVNLNLLAPIFINNILLKELRDEKMEIVIVNVTSGAAERPIHGWGIYNSTKAAINMHTKVAGLEQENMKSLHKIVAFSPGIMDTDMQGTIRKADEGAFKEINKFLHYKNSGALRKPSEVAKAMVDLIVQQNLENGKIYSINELI